MLRRDSERAQRQRPRAALPVGAAAHASPFRVLLRGRDLASTENATVTLPPGLSTKYDVAFELPETEESNSIDDDHEGSSPRPPSSTTRCSSAETTGPLLKCRL